MKNAHAREPGHAIAGVDQPEPLKTYATPRLTRWGVIPRVTEADPGDFSVLPPS